MWKRQLKIKWEDTDHPFDWIDADKVRPSDAKIGDAVEVVYFDGGLYLAHSRRLDRLVGDCRGAFA
jgi:hypothetical protein